jgi:hypothetical protein
LEGWTLVLPGFWNPRIFSPAWLQARGLIEQGQQVALALPVTAIGPPQLSFGGVSLRVDSQKLILGTESPEDDRLQRMEQVATTVLAQLSHTPVGALGVNFQWAEQNPPQSVLACFDTADAGDLADAGLQIRETSVTRQLDDDGRMLNLTLKLEADGQAIFDFNFHFATNSADAAREALAGRLVMLRDRAKNILETVYELEAVAQ